MNEDLLISIIVLQKQRINKNQCNKQSIIKFKKLVTLFLLYKKEL